MRMVSKVHFARLLGVTPGRLTQFKKMGMPVRPNGALDQDEALAWVAGNVDGPAAERAHALLTATAEPIAEGARAVLRNGGGTAATTALTYTRTEVARERAALLRLQRRELEGELAPVAELADALRTMVLTLRSAALGLPSKVAPRLVMMRTVGQAKTVLDAEVRDWLSELAAARIRIIRKTKPEPGWEAFVEYRDPKP
jgi:phage terminase Nu1 subunit (DNA packaging protein)